MNYWNDNNLESVSEENLRYFYEEFSAGIRKQLLIKNLMVPQNVYDVLYPRTKEALLAKNVVKITNLEENSKTLRDALIAKMVSSHTDLETISENTRNSLLARNKIIQEANDLLNASFSYRENLLSKNVIDNGDLLNDSDSIRRNNVSKNIENVSAAKNIDINNEGYRVNNLSKNIPDTGDLLNDSQDFRSKNVSKNVEDSGDLLTNSKSFLNNSISLNVPGTGDLLNDSVQSLANNLASNVPDTGDLLTDSVPSLASNLAQNVPDTGDLLNDSQSFLENNISANVPDAGDLLTDSQSFLKNNVSLNVPNTGDLLTDSVQSLTNNVSLNVPDSGDLLADSESFLKNNISLNVPDSGDLLTDSKSFLKNNVSLNVPDTGDLLADSVQSLANNISLNVPDTGDLATDSQQFLVNNVSLNVPDTGDLLTDSVQYLTNNISLNVPDTGDLATDSQQFLTNNVSLNVPGAGDLITDSQQFLVNNVSLNVPDTGDLLTDSALSLTNNISLNVPGTGDLLTDSQPFLTNNVSLNVPGTGDLLTDSAPSLVNNLAPNVPGSGDLLTDSAPSLASNLAPNVPGSGDLLTDSAPSLASNLAPNVPGSGDLLTDSAPSLSSNLAPNVPGSGDLLIDSVPFLSNNLSNNVPTNSNLQSQSSAFRDNNLAFNVSNHFDILSYSNAFRINNLSANPPSNQLGVVIEGIGTSTFLGISRVLTQGIILRQLLLSKNKPSKSSIDNFTSVYTLDKTSAIGEKDLLISKNKFQIGKIEYTPLNANLVKGDTISFFDGSVKHQIQNQLNKISVFNSSTAVNLQGKYGTNNTNAVLSQSIGGGFYSLDTVNPKGGWFDAQSAPDKVQINTRNSSGSMTEAIRNYNLSRNLYNLYKLSPGDSSEPLSTLQQNTDGGFQDLIAQTIGYLKGSDSIGVQTHGNLIPRAMLTSNEGAYIKGGSPEKLLRTEELLNSASASERNAYLGTAASMMAQTVPGNPLMDTEFKAGTKGISNIMKTIRDSYKGGDSDMTQNYFSQGEKDSIKGRKFVLGTKSDGSPKIGRQRFNVANPYKPGMAKTLLFYMQNYSSGQGFYFPPYIQNYSDSYGANWNTVNFLGRPEPVYTYNNSTREGTISFIVLTDYTQNLIIGKNFNDNSMGNIIVNPTTHFTTKDVSQNELKKISQASNPAREAEKKKIDDSIKEKEAFKKLTPGGTVESGNSEIENLKKESNTLGKNIENSFIESNHGNSYSETSDVIGNINDFMTSVDGRDAGNIDTKAEDSKKRIDEMIKNLAFQPAFFSGDKVDFQTKMDFLAKLTRPAAASECSGFSFTRPPVCHIHLGDWWNNDIVVDNVSFNYDDVPWTLDEGRVQPMWAVVNLNFKFIGPYRGQTGGPVLSDDNGGLYWERGKNPTNIK